MCIKVTTMTSNEINNEEQNKNFYEVMQMITKTDFKLIWSSYDIYIYMYIYAYIYIYIYMHIYRYTYMFI